MVLNVSKIMVRLRAMDREMFIVVFYNNVRVCYVREFVNKANLIDLASVYCFGVRFVRGRVGSPCIWVNVPLIKPPSLDNHFFIKNHFSLGRYNLISFENNDFCDVVI